MKTKAAIVLIAMTFGILAHAGPAQFPNQQLLEQGRDDVRKLLQVRSCAKCHTEHGPGTSQKALGIFDLDKKDWSVDLTVQFLYGLRNSLITSPRDPALTLSESEKLASFVINEIVVKAPNIWNQK